MKYLGEISDKRITCGLHVEMIDGKIFRTFIIIHSLFKVRAKAPLHEPSIKRLLGQEWLRLAPPGNFRQNPPLEISAPAK
jgi:hypothetical protein